MDVFILDESTNQLIAEQRDPVPGDRVEIHENGTIRREQYHPVNQVDNSALIAIVIDAVPGELTDFDDQDNEHTLQVNTDYQAAGDLDIPDKKFRVPFMRLDTGLIIPMVAEVKEGKFTITMNFDTRGTWVVNTELLNSQLPQQLFSIDEQKFLVV